MPRESTVRIVRELASHGYNADREAVTALAGAPDPQTAVAQTVERAPADAVVITTDDVESALATLETAGSTGHSQPLDQNGSPGDQSADSTTSPAETMGSADPLSAGQSSTKTVRSNPNSTAQSTESTAITAAHSESALSIDDDVVSTGTGDLEDFVDVFRDRYERLSSQLRSRVRHRPTDSLDDIADGSDAALIGMVTDIRTTKNGHWRIELEDTNGRYPCLILNDRDVATDARTLLTDEIIAVEGSVSNGDGDGIIFVDDLYFPDVPRTYSPATADRQVEVALLSDLHVGSQEFRADAWNNFADWLHTEEADPIEYLLIAGDMVEGVGVYPGQDEELDIVDIYDQYEAFNEHLKSVPGDLEVVLIPGNHDAVRLAEPQPAFEDELQSIMSAHDVRIGPNPTTVTIEGVSILMYHGVSLDEVIAELPAEQASYDEPHLAMAQLLRKRHIAPKYGGMTRIAPEERDHLVIDEVPDIFHAGHVHKLGYGTYHNVMTINSGCWQAQTAFQESVNIDPDVAYAPIVDLETLELTIRQFG